MKRINKNIIFIFFILLVAFIGYVHYNDSRIVNIIDEEIAMSGFIGVTPQMFGAKGDGKTNDSKAVQAAIDYASKSDKYNVVYIPAGIYSVKKLKVKKDVELVGEGEKSVLLADPSISTWNGILSCKNLDSVKIKRITFDGNKPIVPGNTQEGSVNLWVTSCSNVMITDCIFQNNYYLGICLQNSNDVTIENNQFLNIDCGVITSNKPSNNLLIKSNYFDGAEYSEPIAIYGQKEGYHNNITIIDNTIKSHTKGSGIAIRAAKDVIVKNNVIENCCTGIYCNFVEYDDVEYGVYNAVIEENTITDSVCEGILIKNINDSRVINNNINDSGTYGVFTKYVNNSDISYNYINYSQIRDNYNNGFSMNIHGTIDSTVSYNVINIGNNQLLGNRNPININADEVISKNNIFTDNSVEMVDEIAFNTTESTDE